MLAITTSSRLRAEALRSLASIEGKDQVSALERSYVMMGVEDTLGKQDNRFYRLAGLATMRDGWFLGNGAPPSPDTIAIASLFVDLLASEGVRMPYITPKVPEREATEGGLVFAWHNLSYTITLTLDNDGSIAYHCE